MQEAEQALTLDKLLVIDRQIRVELARSAFESKGQSSVTQFAAVQLQQIAQLQRAQMEQHSLAAHVASMRVHAKQTQGALAPGTNPVSTASPCAICGTRKPLAAPASYCSVGLFSQQVVEYTLKWALVTPSV